MGFLSSMLGKSGGVRKADARAFKAANANNYELSKQLITEGATNNMQSLSGMIGQQVAGNQMNMQGAMSAAGLDPTAIMGNNASMVSQLMPAFMQAQMGIQDQATQQQLMAGNQYVGNLAQFAQLNQKKAKPGWGQAAGSLLQGGGALLTGFNTGGPKT